MAPNKTSYQSNIQIAKHDIIYEDNINTSPYELIISTVLAQDITVLVKTYASGDIILQAYEKIQDFIATDPYYETIKNTNSGNIVSFTFTPTTPEIKLKFTTPGEFSYKISIPLPRHR